MASGQGAVMNIGEDRKQWESPPRSGVLIQINNRKDGAAGVERSFLLFKTVVGSISHDIQK